MKQKFLRLAGLWILLLSAKSVAAQGIFVDFNSIPTTGTILVYAHHDDDLIWMLPFWPITDKFISGAMPSTPQFESVYLDQQTYIDNHGLNIPFRSNWYTPWAAITDNEYTQYYWGQNPDYNYLQADHLETKSSSDRVPLSDAEINKIKAKLEEYIASPEVSRIITHNNYGEYNNMHHVALNKAVRQLAVKYRKDVWMLGCYSRYFIDWPATGNIKYTYGNYNQPELFDAVRNIYKKYGRWSWYDDTPTGNKRYIMIVENGTDRSNVFNGDPITYPGPNQAEPGAYIFDGTDDFMTLNGNNDPHFTISMWIRPDHSSAMDISMMGEHPMAAGSNRNLYIDSQGRVAGRLFNGSENIVTSVSVIEPEVWTHVALTFDGSVLKLYVNGQPEASAAVTTPAHTFTSPEFIMGPSNCTGSYYQGQIFDVGLVDYALSEEQIDDLSRMGYLITSGSGSGGTISPSGAMRFEGGESQTYSIHANAGYIVSDVRVDGISKGAISSYTFHNINTNHSITAVFSPTTYTIAASAGSGGSINPTGQVSAVAGTNRTFTITPNSDYNIADVKVDQVSVGAVSSYTFQNLNANHTIAATFSLKTYTLTTSATSGGSVDPLGTVTVNRGSSTTITILPNEGNRIADVKVDNVSVGAVSSYTLSQITANHTLAASFSLKTYSITAGSSSGGTIAPSGTISVNHGSNKSFSIVPNPGYKISDVRVNHLSVGTPSTYSFVNIKADQLISASFTALAYYTLSALSGQGGTISPGGDSLVQENSSITYTLTPLEGYVISDVLVDGVSAGAVSSYTFTHVTGGHRIEAVFSPLTYIIQSSAMAGGTIIPTGRDTVLYGEERTYQIRANEGFQIADVRVDGSSVGSVDQFIFDPLSSDHTIEASFKPIRYRLTSRAGIGGTIDPEGTDTVEHGSDRTFTIIPDPDYKVSDVRLDGVSLGALHSYTLTHIHREHTLVADFAALARYRITPVVNGSGGTIQPSGITELREGSDTTFTIAPAENYRILNVYVDNAPVGAIRSYTFTNLQGHHRISAYFAPEPEGLAYPNPFKDEFILRIHSTESEYFEVTIYNESNQKVLHKSRVPSNTDYPINLGALPAGIYLVRVSQNHEQYVWLRVVKR
jgi:hypothetical protein